MRKRIISFLLALSIVMSLFGFPLSMSAAAPSVSVAVYNGQPSHSVIFTVDDIESGVPEITVGVERGPGRGPVLIAGVFPTNGASTVSGTLFPGALSDTGEYSLVVYPGGEVHPILRTAELGLTVAPTEVSAVAGGTGDVAFTIDRSVVGNYQGALTITAAPAWMPTINVPAGATTANGTVTVPADAVLGLQNIVFTVESVAMPNDIVIPGTATLALTVIEGDNNGAPPPWTPGAPAAPWVPPAPGLPPLRPGEHGHVTITAQVPVNLDEFRITGRIRQDRMTTSFPQDRIDQAVDTAVNNTVIFGLEAWPDLISVTFSRRAINRFVAEGLQMRFDTTNGRQMLLSASEVAYLPIEQRAGAITVYLDFGEGITDAPPPEDGINVLRFEVGNRNFQINDMHAGTLDAAPFIEGDRVMVPLRVVGERMGATVGWNHGTRTVTISGYGQNFELQVDTPLPGGMGMPLIVADRTFVPIRYVSEMLGAYVRWDAAARAVYVYL